jgi:hypothetical protein
MTAVTRVSILVAVWPSARLLVLAAISWGVPRAEFGVGLYVERVTWLPVSGGAEAERFVQVRADLAGTSIQGAIPSQATTVLLAARVST